MSKEKVKKGIHISLKICFVIYLLLLIYFLFFCEDYGRTVHYRFYQFNLVPFREIIRFLRNRSKLGNFYVLINILGNIIAFMPLGFFTLIIYREQKKIKNNDRQYLKSFLAVTILGFLLVISIEAIQMFTLVGCFDVDDIILNITGIVLGFTIYVLANEVLRKIQYEKK